MILRMIRGERARGHRPRRPDGEAFGASV
jgi:hypothetical protein